VGSFVQHVRYAARWLGRNRGSTFIAVLSLALGIGVNSALFSVADAILLRPLDVRDPDRLFSISVQKPSGQGDSCSWREFQALRDKASVFESLASYSRHMADLDDGSEPVSLLTTFVSPDYFDVLGVTPQLGSLLPPHEGDPPSLVISDRLWKRQFNADPGTVGRVVLVNRREFRISGVLPAGFGGLVRGISTELFLSNEAWAGVLGAARVMQDNSYTDFELIGRLGPGVSQAAAEGQAGALLVRLQEQGLAPEKGRRARVSKFEGGTSALRTLAISGILLCTVGLVLLIACANVVNLRLVQNEARRQEFAVRRAIGVGSARFIGQLLTESLLLSVLGAGAGLLLAAWLIRAAPGVLLPPSGHIDFNIRIDARVVAFTLVATVLATLVSGLAPALQASKRDLLPALRGDSTPERGRLRRGLVVAQVALSTALLVAAGMFARSLANLAQIRPGMDPERSLLLVEATSPNRQANDLMAAQLAALPGVRRTAYARRIPLSGSGDGAMVKVEVPGRADPSGKPLEFRYNQVSAEFFAATGARIFAGRPFQVSDAAASTPVVIVSESFARKFFAGANAVGQWIRTREKDWQIVGIAEDGPMVQIRGKVEPFLYFPYAQFPSGDASFFIDCATDPGAMSAKVRRMFKESGFSVSRLWTLRQFMGEATHIERATSILASAVGALALLLASGGLLGVLLYTVSRRTREFGIRMALGAQQRQLQGRVLLQGLRLALAGLAIGLALAGVGAVLLRSLFYGVSPVDPLAFGGGAGVVLLMALLASALPAWRAARVDPTRALRYE